MRKPRGKERSNAVKKEKYRQNRETNGQVDQFFLRSGILETMLRRSGCQCQTMILRLLEMVDGQLLKIALIRLLW